MDAQLQAAVRDRNTLTTNSDLLDVQEKEKATAEHSSGGARPIDPFETGKARTLEGEATV